MLRWSLAEETALLRALLQTTISIGTESSRVVPWSRMRGLRHGTSACQRRVDYHRNAVKGDSRVLFGEVLDAAGEVYTLRGAEKRAALRAKLEAKLQQVAACAVPAARLPGSWAAAGTTPAVLCGTCGKMVYC
jgi:hypothetical protein